ncbi:uncharacterized protein LOC117282255 [Cryptotermes secundus]|uniref:uncharacterized protein LOC117282255 n=1 Tax=Cryptotermes secundus TaxID=105785 RepID=UPI001454C941|nr:uncharacterized protein LOC117282255 [Cryptotermes secundus]
MCLCSFVAFTSLYATLVCIACSQLEKLRANLLDIRQEFGTPAQDSGAETDTEEEEQVQMSQEVFCRMQEQLNDCIRHHQLILEFMRGLEETLNPMLLAHFLLIVGGMCFAAFSAVTSSGHVLQMAQVLIVYIAFVCQLYTYCWFGTQLTQQAEFVSDAAWGCDWIGTPISFQRCLIFIIGTARREFTLTAGKYMSVSCETMLKHSVNLEHIMENFRVVFPVLSAMWVQMSMSFQRKAAKRLMLLAAAFKWEVSQNKTIADDNFKMTNLLPAIKSASLRILTIFFSCHTCYISLRLALGENRPLSINAYYGFNTTSSPLYELINLSQLEKLRANLLDIRQEYKTQEQDSGAETDREEEETLVHTSQEVFRRMQGELKDCIRHHQQILRYMKALEEAMNPILMGQFLLILTGMCFAAFSFAMVRKGEMLQAESVRDAAWRCDWVGMPVSFQRCLVFITAMASKGFTLTAGKFVPVSRTTMLNVINQTFSYLMFLMQVKDKEKEDA